MSLISKIGSDTISRLQKAATLRFAEAEYLGEGGYSLASIYFHGYAVEIILGVAYFRVLGFGQTDPIDDDRRRSVLASARILSDAEDKSHPVDGLARLLIQDKRDLRASPFDEKLEHEIGKHASIICNHWGPRLRYRAISPTSTELKNVQKASKWFADHRDIL